MIHQLSDILQDTFGIGSEIKVEVNTTPEKYNLILKEVTDKWPHNAGLAALYEARLQTSFTLTNGVVTIKVTHCNTNMFGEKYVSPLSAEQQVAMYNATHTDSHMVVEHLTKEEIQKKYGTENEQK